MKNHLFQCTKLLYGLTKLQTRELAYEFALRKNRNIPQKWHIEKKAGEDWLQGFRKRHSDISLRRGESTSLARAAGFNKSAVHLFFSNLKEIYSRVEEGLAPQFIFNLDETGINTVPTRSSKILAAKGAKQVGQIVSGERGTTVTMCCCVNALGQAFPPAYIFPRVNFKEHMLQNAPAQSLGLAHPSGYMTKDNFVKVLSHFLKHIKVSTSNPGLLLMDSHSTHLTIEAVQLAVENGLSILTFPPPLQPQASTT